MKDPFRSPPCVPSRSEAAPPRRAEPPETFLATFERLTVGVTWDDVAADVAVLEEVAAAFRAAQSDVVDSLISRFACPEDQARGVGLAFAEQAGNWLLLGSLSGIFDRRELRAYVRQAWARVNHGLPSGPDE